MTEHELTKITLTLDTDVKGSDVDTIDALADALEKLDKVPVNTKISGNLKKIAEAFSVFNNLNLKTGVGANIGGIVETISKIENVKDISPYAENLKNGFKVLADAVKSFEGNAAKVPVNLGRGITGIVEATNKITEVKDISQFGDVLKRNFKAVADAAKQMSGIQVVNYSGVAKMIETLGNVGEIQPIGNNVVENASKLAKAINILDANVDASAPRLNALANASNAVSRGFSKATKGSSRFGSSLKLINTAVIIRAINTLGRSLTSLTRKLYGVVDAYGDVQNTMSFFTESLGDQASKTGAIIQQYVDLGAVRFDEFADQVAKLNQIYRGYGIASEDAAKMALNLTQIAYDASYALGQNGKDIALWMQRATSVATGQTRAGYYFGVDTSIAALREEFDHLSASTDKATKSYAAYETIIRNTTAIQGQLAREYTNTYVQMQVFQNRVQQLKQSIGIALVPMFQTIIRWGLTTLKVIEYVIDAIVRLFGGEGFELINYSNMIDNIANSTNGVAGATEDVVDGITGANKAAKELKKTISGIDQVFTINDITGSGAGGGSGVPNIGGASGIGVSGYDWLETLASAENMGMLSKIEADAKNIVENLKDMVPLALTLGGLFAGWKLLNLITDLGTALTKMGELSGVLSGLGSIVIGVTLALIGYEIFKDGLWGLFDGDITWGNIGKTIGGAIMAGIGLGMVAYGAITVLTSAFPESALATWAASSGITLGGLIKVGIGVGLALGGVALMLSGFKDAFENGFDWKNMGMVAGGIILTGIGLALAASAVKSVIGKATGGGELAGNVVESLTGAKTQVEAIDTATGGVSKNLVSLAKNIAVGVGILALVAAAAVIFVGAIWLIGEMLQKVGEAWEPVIQNGGTIALGIALGTALLAGVGAAAFALGSATVASGGTIPIAIGIGTAMLVLLGAATLLFIEEIATVGDRLINRLSPSLAKLNEVMPDLVENMRSFTDFMIEFAGHVLAYSASSTISGIGATINTIVGWFTKDPIKAMADDVKKNEKQFRKLNSNLDIVNPLVRRGNDLILIYFNLLERLKANADRIADIGTPATIGTNFKDFAKALKDGFADLDKVKTNNISKIMGALSSLDLGKFRGIGTSIVQAMELGINNYSYNFNTAINKIRNGLSFNANSVGSSIAGSIITGINSRSVNINTFANRIKNALNFSANYIGNNIATGVINGINAKYVNVNTFTNNVKRAMNKQFMIFSPSRWARDEVGEMIGEGVLLGVNNTDVSFDPFKRRVAKEMSNIMPTVDTRKFSADISSLSSSLSNKVSGSFDYTNDGTERAVDKLANIMNDKIDRLIAVTEDGKVLEVDGEVLGKTSEKYRKGNAVRLNKIFG